MDVWEEYVTLTPSEWYEWFIMANRDVSVTFWNNMKARAYVVGRHDSLAKGHYDGEYLNIELWSEDNEGPDPNYEIAIDLWDSCQDIEFLINHDQYIIHIRVDEVPDEEV